MKIEIIVYDIKVYEYESSVVPVAGGIVKKLHGTVTAWRINEVRHIIDSDFICERVILIAEVTA